MARLWSGGSEQPSFFCNKMQLRFLYLLLERGVARPVFLDNQRAEVCGGWEGVA